MAARLRKKWTASELEPVLGYLGLLREHLFMQNWKILVSEKVISDEGAEDIFACTWQLDNHYTAVIELGPKFFGLSPGEVRNTLVHELVHISHREVSDSWEEVQNSGRFSSEEMHRINKQFRRSMERFVSWVAGHLSESAPEYSQSRVYLRPWKNISILHEGELLA